ncbi:MAG: ADP-ribosylglycohydrolase family protein [Desulfarculaceae bacterium]
MRKEASHIKQVEAGFSRLAGAALGTMCGDALGMPVEGWSAAAIAGEYGRLHEMVSGRLPPGSYTDDSQMMIAILETLAHCGRLDPAYLARRFVEGFEPWRGYGGRIFGVMDRLRAGVPWDQAGTDSFGNGGAMRVGVIDAFYAGNQERLLNAALDQCRITHFHPQGLASAAAQALAVGLACRLGVAGSTPDAAAFVEHLAQAVEDMDFHFAGRLRAMPELPLGDEVGVRKALGSVYACDVTAAEAVPPAIGCFLGAGSAEQAVVMAVSLGGDTDTIGAMAGALAGAYWGIEALPRKWLDVLENGSKGRDYAAGLCRRCVQGKTS